MLESREHERLEKLAADAAGAHGQELGVADLQAAVAPRSAPGRVSKGGAGGQRRRDHPVLELQRADGVWPRQRGWTHILVLISHLGQALGRQARRQAMLETSPQQEANLRWF
jgi:hypothetical protein